MPLGLAVPRLVEMSSKALLRIGTHVRCHADWLHTRETFAFSTELTHGRFGYSSAPRVVQRGSFQSSSLQQMEVFDRLCRLDTVSGEPFSPRHVSNVDDPYSASRRLVMVWTAGKVV